ncbi:MAG: hypothetical protein ACFFD7_07735 [Candidatus Thorarchaeota archaeon]
MHINVHFGIGVIIASIFNYFFKFTFLEYFLVLMGAFICDFDIFFSNYALENNHRLLITHSVIPGVIILIIGLVFNLFFVIISGLNYIIHIIIDTFDWGTNIFYFQKKQVGLKFLISKEEFDNISKYLEEYKNPQSFFDKRYYGSKVCLILEALVFIVMIFCLAFFAMGFFIVILIYFLFLAFHLYNHFVLKKIESH